MKKYVAALGSGMFFVICVSLYLMLESVNSPGSHMNDLDQNAMNNIEVKIKQIENDLNSNQASINAIKDSIRDLAGGETNIGSAKLQQILKKLEHDSESKTVKKNFTAPGAPKKSVSVSSDVCDFSLNQPLKPDIQMMDVLERLPFDNPDGGVWKQGFPISVSDSDFQQRKLQVFVVPHSHCDPGWLKTFEKYYTDQTRDILNNMVAKLEQHEKMKFIYAEVSFFSLWWNEISASVKERVKKLIDRGKLEIVTGGWVMTDEANAHYFAMLDQLIEGNQWLHNHLGYKSQNGWAIDPFGYSPTMAYLLKEIGLDNMLIQRGHYAVKKDFAKKQTLEFMWRQTWDHDGSTDMFCHMMPFYSYDVPHTCGPDPSVCCQFDFRRLSGGKISCPWKASPQTITQANVKSRVDLLLDQYRKKSKLFKSNVLLIPLGDDFRYDTALEWDQQYNNYMQMFEYMNSHPELHVQAQFGTLSDYFSALHTEMKSTDEHFPTLNGDFFTYSDRDDHYWSGYYTSRPFQKRFDRIIEANLRGTEIIFTQAWTVAKNHDIVSFPVRDLMKQLVDARRALGLFQHHDGITGTAKDFVVNDYGMKMLNGLNGLKNVVQKSAQLLMTPNLGQYSPETVIFDVDEVFKSHDSLPDKTVLKLKTNEAKPVVFYNSLGHTRHSMIRLYVDTPHVKVLDHKGETLDTQVDPFWTETAKISSILFKVVFVINVPALGMSRYTIVKDSSNPRNSISRVTLYNAADIPQGEIEINKDIFDVDLNGKEDIVMENGDIRVHMPLHQGTVQSITLKESDVTIQSKVSFLMYGTVSKKDRSGAYLFLPDGHAKEIYYAAPMLRYIHGPLVSEVHAMFRHVEHVTRIHNSPGLDSLSVDIYNIVDIRSETNKEMVMRVETDIKNTDKTFYTDLNGFQIQRRKTYDKVTIQGNFYPMPTVSFIEDNDYRFTVLSAQSLGTASLKPGWIEVVQDRRLNQDDNRGLAQGVMDNRRTPNRFRFLAEKRADVNKTPPKQPAGYMSLVANMASQEFIHPVHVLPSRLQTEVADVKPRYEPLLQDLPCDVHLVNWRTLQGAETDSQDRPHDASGMIYHRYGVDCSYPSKAMTCSVSNGKVSLNEHLSELKIDSMQSKTLNLLHNKAMKTADSESKSIHISPMELQAYTVTIKQDS